MNEGHDDEAAAGGEHGTAGPSGAAHDVHPHGSDHGEDDHPPPAATVVKTRPAESGGPACQLDLRVVLPGAKDDKGRFAELEELLETRRGVLDVHLRGDAEPAEICVHYDPALVSLLQLQGLVRSTGAEVAQRYLQKSWIVRGMDCAQCASSIEHTLARLPGVLSASVAYSSERLVLEYDKETLRLRDVEKRVSALGFELEDAAPGHVCGSKGHGGGNAPDLELPLAITSCVLVAVGWAVQRWVPASPVPPVALFVLGCAAGVIYAARSAFNSVRQLRFDIETLMVIAAIAAALLGAWFEAGLLLALFSLGHALEHRALERARTAIESLVKLRPETARVARDGALVEVPVAEVKKGDVVTVRPGDRVPLDGIIRSGQSALDQAAITGESVPVSKGPGEPVFAGTINTESALEIEVTKLSTESALARVVDMVADAEAQRAPRSGSPRSSSAGFLPVVLVAAPALALGLYLTGTPVSASLLRAAALLVAASPCALAIATPAAILSAVARAARGGVLMKGGAHLEVLGNVKAIAFDKTGTLTEGKPKLLTVTPAGGATEAELLAAAAGAESLSSHPLARAIVDGARERGVTPGKAEGSQIVHGKGLRTTVDGAQVEVGSLGLFEAASVPPEAKAEVERLEVSGQTTMIVRRGERFLGVLGVADTVRAEAKDALAELRRLGIERTVMLSGDNLRVARAVSAQVGITDPRAPLMPEGKVEALRALAKEGGVAMVGDGVNDAPALAVASVGIAIGGAGSDVALETADVVLMADDLRRLPFAVGLARASSRVVRQNVYVSLAIGGLLVLATVFGWVRIAEAVVIHEGSTLFVLANALRLLAYKG
ncbi:MAG: cation-translocating P-type ATPase [Polyangiaceae bacterium]